MRAAICLVFNDHFKDAEMLSMGVIKDCAGKSRSSKVRATGCGSSIWYAAQRCDGAFPTRPIIDSKSQFIP